MSQNHLSMDLETINAATEGYFAGLKIVSEYLTKCQEDLINPVLSTSESELRDSAIKTLYVRAVLWVQALERLNHYSHVQSSLSATRSLLELVVDLILLHCDKTNLTAEKMNAFAELDKWRGCRNVVEFFTQKGLPIPDKYQIRELTYHTQDARMDSLKKQYWNNKNVRRWSGRNGILEDIKEADRLYGQSITDEIGISLEELYLAQYKFLSWSVHSNTGQFWDAIPQAYYLACGTAFDLSATLGMLCVKIVLNDFGLSAHLPELGEKWDQIKERRAVNVLSRIQSINANE